MFIQLHLLASSCIEANMGARHDVGTVNIHVVQEEEEAVARAFIQPLQRELSDLVSMPVKLFVADDRAAERPPLQQACLISQAKARWNPVHMIPRGIHVGVKPLIELKHVVEVDGVAADGRRFHAGVVGNLSQRGGGRGERLDA